MRSRGLPHASLTFDKGLGDSLILGQLALLLWGVAPAVLRELLQEPGELRAAVFTRDAWCLLLALATFPAVEWLRGRRNRAAVLGVFVLLPLPLLVAGALREHSAVAALAWGLAIFFLAASPLSWLRPRWACGGGCAAEATDPTLRHCLLSVGAMPGVEASRWRPGGASPSRVPSSRRPSAIISLVIPMRRGHWFRGHA